ncbi:MAG: helix-turn-helix transcriptional regulator [Solirubrobacteraceae bacterium]
MSRLLRRSESIGELLAAAADAARRQCGFSRGLVLGIAGRSFNAHDTDPLHDPASDRLRRVVLSAPISVASGSLEDLLCTAAGREASSRATARSCLAPALGLAQFALAPVHVDGEVGALLVVDRDLPEVRPIDRALIDAYAAMLGVLIEQQLMRARIADVAAELRRVTTFTHALMRETVDAKLTMPFGSGQHLTPPGVLSLPGTPKTMWDYKLTGQELRVARLLATGRSNREIAEELVVSVDTVKSHVARVLRKLGVSNRAQAAIVFSAGSGDRRAAS